LISLQIGLTQAQLEVWPRKRLREQGGGAHFPHGASMESVTCHMAFDPSLLCITRP